MTPSPRPTYVVDTSVAVKWFIGSNEADYARARELRDSFIRGGCTLRAPELLASELANALKMGRRLKSSEVLGALEQLRELDLELEAFRWTTLARAVEIAYSCDVAVYDAYFLAMALESEGILVTADETFLRKCRRYPATVSLSQLRLPL